MADLYLKALQSERTKLWAEARLKGLPHDTPQRQRIREIDERIAAHKTATDKTATDKGAKPAKPPRDMPQR